MKRFHISIRSLFLVVLIFAIGFTFWIQRSDSHTLLGAPDHTSGRVTQRTPAYKFESQSLITAVEESEILRSPSWEVDQPHPPLSMREAIKLGWIGIEELPVDRNEIDFESAEVVRLRGDKWYYVINFSRPEDSRILGDVVYPVIVLMDRRVAVPMDFRNGQYYFLRGDEAERRTLP